ncbi:Purine nucleoside phosphorylase, partial [Trichoplax sp. H2]
MDTKANSENYSYEDVEAICKFLLEKSHYRPKIGIICGSGLSNLADILQEQEVIAYSDIPNFPTCT